MFGLVDIPTAFLKAEFHVGTIRMKSQPNVWFCHICPVQKSRGAKKCFAIPILGPIAVYFPDRMNPKDKFGLKAKVPVGHIRYTHPSPGHTLASPSRAARRDSPFSILQVTEA